MNQQKVIIDGVGSYIPERVVKNEAFLDSEFYQENGEKFEAENLEIIQKFEKITGIRERRYANDDQKTSDLAAIAAQRALESSSIDKEDLDYIIVAHNFGDISPNSNRSDFMPSLAARVKNHLDIFDSDLLIIVTSPLRFVDIQIYKYIELSSSLLLESLAKKKNFTIKNYFQESLSIVVKKKKLQKI